MFNEIIAKKLQPIRFKSALGWSVWGILYLKTQEVDTRTEYNSTSKSEIYCNVWN